MNLLAALLLASPQLSPALPAQEVAELRTGWADTQEDFLLRGVIPVPATERERWKQFEASPYVVLDHTGAERPTQWEKVAAISNYDQAPNAVVVAVELLAEMPRAPSQTMTYTVVRRDTSATDGGCRPGRKANELLNGNLRLYCEDSKGLKYSSKIRVLQDGKWARYGDLVCTKVVTGSLRSSGGAEVLDYTGWLTWKRKSNHLLLDLFVHNAQTHVPRSDVYFKHLWLGMTGWDATSLWDQPTLDPPMLVDSVSGFHWIQRRSGLMFRLVLYPKGDDVPDATDWLDGEGWAVCTPEGDWSWWAKDCGFGPHMVPAPRLDQVRQVFFDTDPTRWSAIVTDLAAGGGNNGPWRSYGVLPDSPYFPWGSFQGGMAGGTEIHACEGTSLAWSGDYGQLNAWRASLKAYSDRCPVWMLDAEDGMPYEPELSINDPLPSWRVGATVTFTKGEEQFFPPADWSEVERVRKQGLVPSYEHQLQRYRAIDFAHYTRVSGKCLVLGLLDNDPMARFMADQFGELAFMYVQKDIRDLKESAAADPHRGAFNTRIQGWSYHAMAIKALFGQQQTRDRMNPYAVVLAEGLDLARMPNLHVHAQTHGKLANNFEDGQYAVNNMIAAGLAPNGEWCLGMVCDNEGLVEGVVMQALGYRKLRWPEGVGGAINKVPVWKKPNGDPYPNLNALPVTSGEVSNFYVWPVALSLFRYPTNSTLLGLFDDMTGGNPDGWFDDRKVNELWNHHWAMAWWNHHSE